MSKIRVLLFKPLSAPVEVEIENDLEPMQKLVGGYIESVGLDGLPPDVSVICNEEGKLNSLPENRSIPGDVLVGDFFVSRVDPNSGESVSLTDEDIRVATLYFKDKMVLPW